MRYAAVLFLVIVAAGGGYFVATKTIAAPQAKPTVAVTRGSISVIVDLTGSVEAKQTRGLAFGTPGIVARVDHVEGDTVKADEAVAELDTTAIDAQLKAAESSLASAASALQVARDAAAKPTRAPSSSPTPAIPTLPGQPTQAQLDANVDAAVAAVDAARAQIEAAKVAQRGATIRAPFDGTVTRQLVNVGDYVGAGPLTGVGFPVEVSGAGTLEVVAGAGEDDVVRLAPNQHADVTFDALSDVRLSGTVCEIPASATQVQGVPTYPITICLDSVPPSVRLGLTASVAVVVSSKPSVLLVPSKAIRISGDDHVVDVMTADGAVVATVIETGANDGTDTEVVSGLKEGDRVVSGS